MEYTNERYEIADGIFWVGVIDETTSFKSNPYLLVDGGEAVLFDPGSVLDFEQVLENVKRIVPLKKIKYVVLHHQDPDLCASVPMFEKEDMQFKIVTHWRTSRLLKYYGITSEYYLIGEHGNTLRLKSGRELNFIPAPYLHFPGAITTYDIKTKTLLSGDLFGAVTDGWSLYADENYEEGMVAFHEHYMPSNEILRPVMETFALMDINLIAPQHGCLIKDQIYEYIDLLKNLECGIFLNPVKKNLKEAGGYAGICSLILKRFKLIYTKKEISEMLSGLDLTLAKNGYDIKDFNYSGPDLWDIMFETIFRTKGIKALVLIEPLMKKLSREYGVVVPQIFRSELNKASQESLILKEEMIELREENHKLNQNIKQTHGNITRDSVTELYNETFFYEYLDTILTDENKEIITNDVSLILFNVDDLPRVSVSYGDTEANNLLKSVAYILTEECKTNHIIFKLESSKFAYLAPNVVKNKAVDIAEKIRNEVNQSKMFIDDISLSAGVCALSELEFIKHSRKTLSDRLYEAAILRLRLAKAQGGDFVCGESDLMDLVYDKGKILIADSDVTNTAILKSYLNNMDYNVITANDGEQAAKVASRELPNLIITEIMLPKMDGFLLRETLSYDSATKNIPFILLSNLKNEDSVKRALSLGIDQFFKKPYMITELLGIVDLKLKE